MTNSGFEENEVSINSNGGTEQCKRLIASHIDSELLDNFQIICTRVREIQPDKIKVLWLHDTALDPENVHLRNPTNRDKFHKLVFCGQYQYTQFVTHLGIPQDDKCAVIETPIEPIPYIAKQNDTIRLIYTSTPQRGLEILVPVFEELAKKYKNIHLDVFSSYRIYGWDEADKKYEHLFERCRQHPQITYHGHAPNEQVRAVLQRAHIFAYPSIWQESNSRSLIEAMSAGLLCLHPNYGGLGDTSGGMTSMYQYIEDHNVHANKFYALLEQSIVQVTEPAAQNYLQFVKAYADARFNVNKIVAQWKDLLNDLYNRYPTPVSRQPQQQLFVYRTS